MSLQNNVNLLGYVVQEPEVRTTNNGGTVVKFRMAVNRPFKKDDGSRESDFFDCVAFGRTADYAVKIVQKGARLLVGGSLRNQAPYENKDGVRVYPRDSIYVDDLTPAAYPPKEESVQEEEDLPY